MICWASFSFQPTTKNAYLMKLGMIFSFTQPPLEELFQNNWFGFLVVRNGEIPWVENDLLKFKLRDPIGCMHGWACCILTPWCSLFVAVFMSFSMPKLGCSIMIRASKKKCIPCPLKKLAYKSSIHFKVLLKKGGICQWVSFWFPSKNPFIPKTPVVFVSVSWEHPAVSYQPHGFRWWIGGLCSGSEMYV